MFEELKKLFVKEVNDIIKKIEALLLEVEENPDDIDKASDIFRHLHTIKGAAGMYGLDKTVKLAHLFEDVYKKVKHKELNIDKRLVDLSFKALDYLRLLINSDEAEVDDEQLEQLRDQLASIVDIVQEEDTKKKEIEKGIQTYYILFEPNADIYERGINLSGIIEDLEALNNKIIIPYSDDVRERQGKLPLFWEIIAVVDNRKKLDDIFIFVQDEVKIIPIADYNVLNNKAFVDFFNKLVKEGYSDKHIEKIKRFFNISYTSEKKESSGSQKEKAKGQEQKEERFEGIESVRVEASQLDNLLNLVSELIIENSRLNEAVKNSDFSLIKEIAEKLSGITSELKEQSLKLRVVPIKILFNAFRRTVREMAAQQGKKIIFTTEGGDTLIDKTIIEKLYTPLLHVIRNAVDHGIETPEERLKAGKPEEGHIRLIAFQTNVNVFIQVQDDGRGLDPDKIKAKGIELGIVKTGQVLSTEEIYELIFMPEFSTATKLSELSGRGIGMDIIRKSIRQIRGNVEIESEKGLGMSVTFKLPSTLSIIETLWVSTGGVNFLIPLYNIVTTEQVNPYELQTVSDNFISFRDELIPLIDAREFFGLGGENLKKEKLIIINLGTRKYAMLFEHIYTEVSAVVKNLGKLLQGLDYFIGASILGDGSIAYIIDPYKILKNLNLVIKT